MDARHTYVHIAKQFCSGLHKNMKGLKILLRHGHTANNTKHYTKSHIVHQLSVHESATCEIVCETLLNISYRSGLMRHAKSRRRVTPLGGTHTAPVGNVLSLRQRRVRPDRARRSHVVVRIRSKTNVGVRPAVWHQFVTV